MGRRAIKYVLLGLVSVAAGMGAFCLFFGYSGYGRFNQDVTVESGVRVKRLLYCTWHVDSELKRIAEEKADQRMFECDEADRIADDHFRVSVTFTSNGCPLFGQSIYYRPQLVAYAELADGKCICRVVDLPSDKGATALKVSLR
jgi:hypothetical protein